jgi:RND superfamily putative drug exporter
MTASTSTGLGAQPVAYSPESPAVEHDGSGSEPSGGDRPHPFARLGAWAATHFRRLLAVWLLVIAAFGFFAVHVESALAGAGWQASGSQSVAARAVIEKDFAGLGATGLQVVIVDHNGPIASDPQAQAIVAKATRVLRNDPRVSTVAPPQAGVSISRDGRTAVITAGAAADSNKMVQAADAVQPKLAALSSSGVSATLTGDSALWAN